MAHDIPKPFFNHADYAGFWVRFCAVSIDMALYSPFYYVIQRLMRDQNPFVTEAVFFIFALLSYAWLFASPMRGSPGMYLLKFHICDTQGRRISFTRALMWGITSAIGGAFCCAGVIYLQMHFDIMAVSQLQKSCVQENITQAECIREIETIIKVPFASFQQLCFAALGMGGFLSLVWVLSVALPKDKTGFHNLLCGTRFVRGRG